MPSRPSATQRASSRPVTGRTRLARGFQHSSRLAQAITWYGWAYIIWIGVMSVVNFEAPVRGLGYVTAFTIASIAFVVVGVVLMVLRYREGRQLADLPVPPEQQTAAVPSRGPWADEQRSRQLTGLSLRGVRPGRFVPRQFGRLSAVAWACIAAVTVLFGYAMATTFFHRQFIWVGFAHVVTDVPKAIIWIPLVNGLCAAWAGFVVMAVTPRLGRLRLLWWISFALVPMTVLGWLRVTITQGQFEPRVWTQLGGAAVYPGALMVAAGIALASFLSHYRPRASMYLFVAHVVLLLATGSRGGLLMLGAFVVLLVIRLNRTHTGAGERLRRLPVRVYVLGGLAVLVAVFTSPILGRLDERSAGRLMTWRVGMGAWNDSPVHMLFGVGSGSIWPWFAYESGWQAHPWRSRVTGPFGYTLYHSHSLYLEVLAELGIIGLLLLAAVVWPIATRWLRGASTANVVLTSAVAACLAGMAFDLYVFKNFGVSLVWWTGVFGALLGGVDQRPGVLRSG
ncbi:O-antigen ligase family protein [Propionibacteriaceae bacterium G1746]|uniref:O-antigen ligase family protein n=1 Tax=Aestuariimicrobium sp. G57 TaxID=3418485 RepID=UPI003C263486